MKLRFCLLILTLPFLSLAQTNLRIEPMNWWVGMKNPALQLLIQGNDIKGGTVISKNPKIKIKKVHQADSPNYLFVDLLIDKNLPAGKYPLQVIKNGKVIHEISYALEQRKPHSAERESYSPKDVIYLITPDRFANGDPSNDAAPSMEEPNPNRSHMYGRHGGDLQGIIDRLDYIKEMGFTAIWNMPVVENNQKNESYHGYSITDHYKIDPRFGTNELYKKLSEEAEKRGIKMVWDIILNHIGSNHYFMKDKPFKDWINYNGEFVSTNHVRETQQDPHASKADYKKQVEGWFVPTMPDLNQKNPFLAKYLIQNTIWWIEYGNLGGLRIDTYPYSDRNFANAWTQAVSAEYPKMNMVGEEWSSNPIITSYWQKGKINRNGYVSGLPSLMDFPLQNALSEGLSEPESWGKGLAKIHSVLSNDLVYPNPENLVIFGDNHDMSRFFTQMKNEKSLFKMGLSMIATLRGIPQIYYGTEINFSNPNSTEHGEIRKDFYGGWKGDAQDAVKGINLSADEKESQDFVKKLLNWRKGNEAIAKGKMTHFAPQNGIYTYFRYTDKSKVMVIVNKNTGTKLVEANLYEELLPSNSKLKNVITGQTSSLGKTIEVPSKSVLIVEILP